ncbi:LOW QUALITY PROTEIN: hypothetical protein Cgig2_015269 [Carnegiea gigantea]|uniref:DUF8040 domain-containing protein n=1 Tax=Carnegiea gigantea TaxID=171969 RepID=A0A9Q1GH73_9CARY|nr:LOW QUALITY PROTEIN: hypothetical protein Cgig2_015269 [Carnegiea gigantea]
MNPPVFTVCPYRRYRKLKVIAASASGKKSANCTNRDDEKLLDILIEQRAQRTVEFGWSSVRVMLKNEELNKESIQIKNCYNDLRKKLGAWEFLIGKTGVGVDYETGAVVVSDSTWQDFLQRYGGKCKLFRKKVPANLEKLKSAFYGEQATGEMSFAPGMVASPSNQSQRSTGKALDMGEHICDSDEANEDGSDAHMEWLPAEESQASPKSVHSSHKQKSEGGTSSDGKRQELLNWSSRYEEVHQALAIIHMREEAKQQPSLTKQMQARLKQHPQISTMGSDFTWSVMDYIHQKNEEDEDDCRMDEEDCVMDAVEGHAIDIILAYTLQRNHVDQSQPAFKERLLKAIGGESGIHRLLNRNRPDLCRKLLRLDKDVFTHLVNILLERHLLKEGRFIKAAEIVVISLFVLARRASYREAEDGFQHSPSTIGKYHKQVLDSLVKLPYDVIRRYQSQDELPAEIFQKQGLYWPFFKACLSPPYTHSHVLIIIYNCENTLNFYSVLKDCIGL